MAIKIVVSKKVKFKVRGTIKDEAGHDQPFDFSLTCQRRDTEEIKALLETMSDQSMTDFMLGVAEDWEGVKDGDGKAVEYSEEALRQLFLIPGVGAIAFRTYFEEAGAKAKN